MEDGRVALMDIRRRISEFGYRASDIGFWISGIGYWFLGIWYWISVFGSCIDDCFFMKDIGHRMRGGCPLDVREASCKDFRCSTGILP